MNHAEKRLADTAVRLKQLYTAAVYDIMDAMGLPNQCLDLGIKPLDRGMRIAGPAFTIACAADARVDWEYDNDEVKRFTFFRRMYRGCVVVVSSGGENRAPGFAECAPAAAASGSSIAAAAPRSIVRRSATLIAAPPRRPRPRATRRSA